MLEPVEKSPAKLTLQGSARYNKLLESAYTLFLECGYENVTLDDVIQHSGGSKSSIYKFFGNKEGLFEAICDYHLTHKIKLLSFPRLENEALEDFLLKILMSSYNHIIQPCNINFLHLILRQAQHLPNLTQYLHQKWHNEFLKIIIDILTECKKSGELFCENPTFSANFFWGILHETYWQAMLRLPNSNNIDVESYFKYCIQCFLQGHLHKSL